jgi:excisionase family DNA binding protein
MNKIYSVYEVAQILQVSSRTILKYIKLGELKAFRFGNQQRVTQEALDSFIKAKELPTKKIKPFDNLAVGQGASARLGNKDE